MQGQGTQTYNSNFGSDTASQWKHILNMEHLWYYSLSFKIHLDFWN